MAPKAKSSLELDFQNAMHEIYRRADEECNYRPTYFLRMLEEHGGVSAARILLGKPQISEGFVKLASLERLDLSVEALVLDPKWKSLFSDQEIATAKRRLAR